MWHSEPTLTFNLPSTSKSCSCALNSSHILPICLQMIPDTLGEKFNLIVCWSHVLAPCFDHLRPSDRWDVTQLLHLSAFISFHHHIKANYLQPFFDIHVLVLCQGQIGTFTADISYRNLMCWCTKADSEDKSWRLWRTEWMHRWWWNIFLSSAQCHPIHLTNTCFSNCFSRIIMVVLNTISLRINRNEALSPDTNTDRFEPQMKLSFHVITVLSQGFFTRHKT